MAHLLDGFIARCIHASEDQDIALVGLADEEYEAQTYVLLQRTLRPSKDDQVTGHDGVHIIVNDQIRSAYGGIESVQLSHERVVISFADGTAERLQVAKEMIVDISAAAMDWEALCRSFRVLCGGYAQLQIAGEGDVKRY